MEELWHTATRTTNTSDLMMKWIMISFSLNFSKLASVFLPEKWCAPPSSLVFFIDGYKCALSVFETASQQQWINQNTSRKLRMLSQNTIKLIQGQCKVMV